MSGSDCGHIFIWSKESGEIVQMLKGDESVVSPLESFGYFWVCNPSNSTGFNPGARIAMNGTTRRVLEEYAHEILHPKNYTLNLAP